MARAVVGDPCAQLRPEHPEAGTEAAARLEFATKVLAELEPRKRRLGILRFDDLLSRLAKALEAEDSPARDACSSGGRSSWWTSSRTRIRCSGR